MRFFAQIDRVKRVEGKREMRCQQNGVHPVFGQSFCKLKSISKRAHYFTKMRALEFEVVEKKRQTKICCAREPETKTCDKTGDERRWLQGKS
jgi:hypothetical protein